MESFAEAASEWANFYMFSGTSAATLIGLIFVAVSLHINSIVEFNATGQLRALANQAFRNFMMILSLSFVFLSPHNSPYIAGAVFALLAALGLKSTATFWYKFLIKPDHSDENVIGKAQIFKNLLIPNTICYLTLMYIALDLLQGYTGNLAWMNLVVIYLLMEALFSSWLLMIRLAEVKLEVKRSD
jgi:hypothetical protein